jgi:hypothetical protein
MVVPATAPAAYVVALRLMGPRRLKNTHPGTPGVPSDVVVFQYHHAGVAFT